jgi:hypothetical protein
VFRDGRAEVLLQRQQALHLAIEGLRPDVRLVLHPNERDRGAQAAALGTEPALEQVVDGELGANLRGGLGGALVVQRAALDDEALRIDLREEGTRLLRQPGGQVGAVRIAADVLERHHGQRDVRNRRPGGWRPPSHGEADAQHDHAQKGGGKQHDHPAAPPKLRSQDGTGRW